MKKCKALKKIMTEEPPSRAASCPEALRDGTMLTKSMYKIYQDKSTSLTDRHISPISKHTCVHVDAHEPHR